MAKVSLPALLKTMVEQDASDLHITMGVPPEYRIGGKKMRVRAGSIALFIIIYSPVLIFTVLVLRRFSGLIPRV